MRLNAWLARAGARPVGVDITPAYVDAATALTHAAGLSEQVSFFSSDIATFDTAEFDAAYTMHVQMNVADKQAYFADMTLGANVTLTSLVNGDISLDNVDGAFSLACLARRGPPWQP